MTTARSAFCGRIALAGLLATALGASTAADELAPFRIENGSIARPLTGTAGNPARGLQIVRDLGHVTCLICHTMPIPDEPDHGAIGPSLAGVGSRFTAGELRLRLVDPKALNPDSIMPSYYRVSGLHRVGQPYRDKPIYTAQEVEDVVAYLSSLQDHRQ